MKTDEMELNDILDALQKDFFAVLELYAKREDTKANTSEIAISYLMYEIAKLQQRINKLENDRRLQRPNN